jgi:hypothetical protein
MQDPLRRVSMTRFVLATVLLLGLLGSAIGSANEPEDRYDRELKRRSAELRGTLVQAARDLLLKEIELVRKIDATRYKGLETELPPVFPDMLKDVLMLLNWATRLEHEVGLELDAKAHFLIGWTHYLQHDLGEFCDEKAVTEAKKHFGQAREAYTKKSTALTQDEHGRLVEMMDTLDRIPPGSCERDLKAIQQE